MEYTVVKSAVIRDEKLRGAVRTLASLGIDNIFSFDQEMDTTAMEVNVSVATDLRRKVADELNDDPEENSLFDEEVGHKYMIEIAEMLERAEQDGFSHVEVVYPWDSSAAE